MDGLRWLLLLFGVLVVAGVYVYSRYQSKKTEEKLARARLLRAEKTAVQRAVSDGLISHHTAEELVSEADEDLDRLTGIGPH